MVLLLKTAHLKIQMCFDMTSLSRGFDHYGSASSIELKGLM